MTETEEILYTILADYSDDLNNLKKRDGKLPAEAAVDRYLALLNKRITEARIDELKQLQPPKQYEEYAKLMGSEVCTICGFNAVKFRDYVKERIDAQRKQLGKIT